ncbi:hypothetical protein KAU32_07975 [bacterium]|nr:hypothetical protein [bacterium]
MKKILGLILILFVLSCIYADTGEKDTTAGLYENGNILLCRKTDNEEKENLKDKEKKDKKHGNSDKEHGNSDEEHGNSDEEHGKSDEEHGKKKGHRKDKHHEDGDDIDVFIRIFRLFGFITTDGYGYYSDQTTPWGATWRSFLIPGWGQCYKRQFLKGWLYFGSAMAFNAVNYHNLKIYMDKLDKYDIDPTNGDYKHALDEAERDYMYILAGHIIFWSFNLVDAAFFDWDDIDLSFRMDRRNNHYLTLTYRF